MARPIGSTKLDKKIPVQVRLSPREREQLEIGARLDGLPLSTWMRSVLLRYTARPEILAEIEASKKSEG
jgi:hypothetical protein